MKHSNDSNPDQSAACIGKATFENPQQARKAAQRGNRRLVVVQMYGTGDLYGQAISLLDWGFSQP